MHPVPVRRRGRFVYAGARRDAFAGLQRCSSLLCALLLRRCAFHECAIDCAARTHTGRVTNRSFVSRLCLQQRLRRRLRFCWRGRRVFVSKQRRRRFLSAGSHGQEDHGRQLWRVQPPAPLQVNKFLLTAPSPRAADSPLPVSICACVQVVSRLGVQHAFVLGAPAVPRLRQSGQFLIPPAVPLPRIAPLLTL